MTTEELKNKFNSACTVVLPTAPEASGIQFLTKVYAEMFQEYPNSFSFENEGLYKNPEADDYQCSDIYTEDREDTPSKYVFENIQINKTMCNIAEYYKDSAYIFRDEYYPVIIRDHQIIFWCNYYHTIYVLQKDEFMSEELKNLVIDNKDDDDHRYFSYVTSTNNGFSETTLECKKQNIDIEMNYNDDLPNDKIIEFLKSNNSGLILLHGEPGTGKTTYIRHLMYDLSGRDFLVMDASVFNYITDASFIELLLDNKNAVIILEDCETMLTDRIQSGNQMLSTLLNLSDGIIGDNMNFKFICTFNAPIGKLDKAIQRKGRMKVKYEFKKLSPEKTKALGQKLGVDIPDGVSLPLSDIFNYKEENGAENIAKKIGFSK